jgi:hypothetical protein
MIVIIVGAGKYGLHYYSPRIDKEEEAENAQTGDSFSRRLLW